MVVLPGSVPPGWYTVPPDYVSTILEGWPGDDHKLPEPYKPLLFSEGEEEVLVQYGHDNYCLWNEISDDICLVEEPKDLGSILEGLGDPMGKASGVQMRFRLLEYPGPTQHVEVLPREHEEWEKVHGRREERARI